MSSTANIETMIKVGCATCVDQRVVHISQSAVALLTGLNTSGVSIRVNETLRVPTGEFGSAITLQHSSLETSIDDCPLSGCPYGYAIGQMVDNLNARVDLIRKQ